jgi:hypothetical protein
VIDYANPFAADSGGRRVLISAVRLPLLSAFLGGTLGELPRLKSSSGSVIDSHDVVIADPDAPRAAGAPLRDRALLAALSRAPNGDYDRNGTGRYYVSASVGGSPWRIVLAADRSSLYASVNGSRRTVPWLVFAALALMAAVGLLLLWRVGRATAELERREINRRHAVEINDNILQRLALAKYDLERGAEDSSQDRLLETMREAQRLVNRLLGDDVGPGDLRRERGAEVRERVSEASRSPDAPKP